MKKSEIQVGGLYQAKVNGVLRRVKVLSAGDRGYRVLNTETGRETTFRTAAKFRRPY